MFCIQNAYKPKLLDCKVEVQRIISESGDASRKLISKQDHLSQFFDSDLSDINSGKIARSIERYIKRTRKYIRETKFFVESIVNKIYLLHKYNLQVSEITFKYPLSQDFIQLLLRYVALECLVLYRKENHTPKYESIVEHRILRLLQRIYISYFETLDNVKPDKIFKECYTAILNLIIKVKLEYEIHNDVMENIAKKLLTKMGRLEEINALTKRSLPCPLDTYLSDPALVRSCKSIITSDYGTDDDLKLEEELSQVNVPFEEGDPSQDLDTKQEELSQVNIQIEGGDPSQDLDIKQDLSDLLLVSQRFHQQNSPTFSNVKHVPTIYIDDDIEQMISLEREFESSSRSLRRLEEDKSSILKDKLFEQFSNHKPFKEDIKPYMKEEVIDLDSEDESNTLPIPSGVNTKLEDESDSLGESALRNEVVVLDDEVIEDLDKSTSNCDFSVLSCKLNEDVIELSSDEDESISIFNSQLQKQAIKDELVTSEADGDIVAEKTENLNNLTEVHKSSAKCAAANSGSKSPGPECCESWEHPGNDTSKEINRKLEQAMNSKPKTTKSNTVNVENPKKENIVKSTDTCGAKDPQTVSVEEVNPECIGNEEKPSNMAVQGSNANARVLGDCGTKSLEADVNNLDGNDKLIQEADNEKEQLEKDESEMNVDGLNLNKSPAVVKSSTVGNFLENKLVVEDAKLLLLQESKKAKNSEIRQTNKIKTTSGSVDTKLSEPNDEYCDNSNEPLNEPSAVVEVTKMCQSNDAEATTTDILRSSDTGNCTRAQNTSLRVEGILESIVAKESSRLSNLNTNGMVTSRISETGIDAKNVEGSENERPEQSRSKEIEVQVKTGIADDGLKPNEEDKNDVNLLSVSLSVLDQPSDEDSSVTIELDVKMGVPDDVLMKRNAEEQNNVNLSSDNRSVSGQSSDEKSSKKIGADVVEPNLEEQNSVNLSSVSDQSGDEKSSKKIGANNPNDIVEPTLEEQNNVNLSSVNRSVSDQSSDEKISKKVEADGKTDDPNDVLESTLEELETVNLLSIKRPVLDQSSDEKVSKKVQADGKTDNLNDVLGCNLGEENVNLSSFNRSVSDQSSDEKSFKKVEADVEESNLEEQNSVNLSSVADQSSDEKSSKKVEADGKTDDPNDVFEPTLEEQNTGNLSSTKRSVADQSSDEKSTKETETDVVEPNLEEQNSVNLSSVADQSSDEKSSKKVEADGKTDDPNDVFEPTLEEQNTGNLSSTKRSVADQSSDEKSTKETETDVVEPNLEEQNSVNLSSVADQSSDEKSSKKVEADGKTDDPNDVFEPTLEEQNTGNLSSTKRSVADQSSDEKSSKETETDVVEPNLEEQNSVNLSSVADQSSDEKSSKKVEADGKTDDPNDVLEPTLEEQNTVNLSSINRAVSDQSTDEKLSKKIEADGKTDNLNNVPEPNLEEQNVNLSSINRSLLDQSSDDKSSKTIETGVKTENLNDVLEPNLEEQNNINLSSNNQSVLVQSSISEIELEVKTDNPDDVLKPNVEEQLDQPRDENSPNKTELEVNTRISQKISKPNMEEQSNVKLLADSGSVSEELHNKIPSEKIELNAKRDIPKSNLEEQNNIELLSVNQSAQPDDDNSSEKIVKMEIPDEVLKSNVGKQSGVKSSSFRTSVRNQAYDENKSKKIEVNIRSDNPDDVLIPNTEQIDDNLNAKGYMNQTSVRNIKCQRKTDEYASILRRKPILLMKKKGKIDESVNSKNGIRVTTITPSISNINQENIRADDIPNTFKEKKVLRKANKKKNINILANTSSSNKKQEKFDATMLTIEKQGNDESFETKSLNRSLNIGEETERPLPKKEKNFVQTNCLLQPDSRPKQSEKKNIEETNSLSQQEGKSIEQAHCLLQQEGKIVDLARQDKRFQCADKIITAFDGKERRKEVFNAFKTLNKAPLETSFDSNHSIDEDLISVEENSSKNTENDLFDDKEIIPDVVSENSKVKIVAGEENNPDITNSPTLYQDVGLNGRKSNILENELPAESSIANSVNDEVSESDVEKEQVFEVELKEYNEIELIAMTDELIVLEEVHQNDDENLLIGESVAVPMEIEKNDTDTTPEVDIDCSDVNENTSDDYAYQIVENADASEEKYFFVDAESGLIDDLNIQKEEIVQTLESGLSKELIMSDTVSQNCEEVLVNSQELVPACKDSEIKIITSSDNVSSGIGTISKRVVRIVPNEENNEVTSDEFIPDGNASLDLLATVASQVSRQNLSVAKKKRKRFASKRRKKQLGLKDKVKLVQKSNGRKKRRGRVQIGPEEIENKRVTRSARIKTKIEDFQQDVKCKPNDFVINDSRVLPSAINIYTQKLPELPWTSEDSNASEGHLLIDEGLSESVKSPKDIKNTCYDEDTMEENLVFQYQPKVKGTVLLSIPDTFQENFGEFLTHIEQLDRFTNSSDNKNADVQDLQDNNSPIEATPPESGISDFVPEKNDARFTDTEKKDTLSNGRLQKSISGTICRKPFRTKAAQKDYDKFSLKPYVSIERMNFASKEEERKYRQTRSRSFDIGIIRAVDNDHSLKEENLTYLDDEQLKRKTNRVHSTEPGVVRSETNQPYLANKLCDLQPDVKEKVKHEGLEICTKRKEDSEDEIPLAQRAHLEAKQLKKSVALSKCVPKKGKSDYKVNTGIKKGSISKAKSKSPKNHDKSENRDLNLVGRSIRKFISKEKISNLLNSVNSKSSNSISPVSSSTATLCSKIPADSSITSMEKAPKSGEDELVEAEISKRDPTLETNSPPKCETHTYEEYIKNSNTIYYTTPKFRRKSVSKQNLNRSGSTDVKLKYYTPPKLRRKSVVDSELVAENTELLKPADTPKTIPITTNVEILTKCKNTVSPTTEKLKSKLENDAKKNGDPFSLIEEECRYLSQNYDDKADNLTSFDVLNCSKKDTEVELPKSEKEITTDTKVKTFMEQNVNSKNFFSDKPTKSGYDTMAATQTSKDVPDAGNPSVIVNRNSEVKYEVVSEFEINRNDKLIENGEENLDSLPLSERASALQKELTKSGIVEKLRKKKGVSSNTCKRNTEKKAEIQKGGKSSKQVDIKFAEDDKISIDSKKDVESLEKGIMQSKKLPKSKGMSTLSSNRRKKLDRSDNCASVVEVTPKDVNEDAAISRKEIKVDIKNFKENENIKVHSTKINKVKEKISSGTPSQGQEETDLDISVEGNMKASPEKEHVASVHIQEKRGRLSKVNIEKEENPTKTKEAGIRAKRTLQNINSEIDCKLDKSDNCASVVEVTLKDVNKDAAISRKEIMVEIKKFKENENIEEVLSTKIKKVKEKISSGTLSQGQEETELNISVEGNMKASPEKEHVASVHIQEKRGRLSKVNIEKEEKRTKTKEAAGIRAKRTLSNINSKIDCTIKDINKDTIKSTEKIVVETDNLKKSDSNTKVCSTKLTEIKEQPKSYSDDSVHANVKAPSEEQREKDDTKLQLEEVSKINFKGENLSKTLKAGAKPKHTPIIPNTNIKSNKEIMKESNNTIKNENIRKGHPTKPQNVEEKGISGALCQDQLTKSVESNVEKNVKAKSERQPETEIDLNLQSVEKVSKINIKKRENLSKTIEAGPKSKHSSTNLNTKLKCSINKATMEVTETNNLKEHGNKNKVRSLKTTEVKVEELSEKLNLVKNETDPEDNVDRNIKIPSEKERKVKEVEEIEKSEATNVNVPDKCKNGEKLSDTLICPQEDETNDEFHCTEKHKLDIGTSLTCKTEHVEEVLTTIISDAALRQVGILAKAAKITQSLNGDVCPGENKCHKKDEANEKLGKSKKYVKKTATKGKQAEQKVAKNGLKVASQIVSDKQDVSFQVGDLGLDLTSVKDLRLPDVTSDDSCVVENKDLNTQLNGGGKVQVEKLDEDLVSKKDLNTESYVSIPLKENSLNSSDHCNSLDKENAEEIADGHSCETSTMKEHINCDKVDTADQSQILFEESIKVIKTCTSPVQKDKLLNISHQCNLEENLKTSPSFLHSKEYSVQNLPEKIPESDRTLSEKIPDANVNIPTSIQQVEEVTLKNPSVTEEVKYPNLKCQEGSQSLEAKEVIKKINSNLSGETAQDIKINKGSRKMETVHIPYRQSENNMSTSGAKYSIENNLITEEFDGQIPKQAKNVKETDEEPQNPASVDMHSTSTKSDSDITIQPVVAPDVCYSKRKRRNSTRMEDNSDKKFRLSEINVDVSSSNLVQSSNIQSPKSVSPRKKDKKSIECIISQLKEEKGNCIDSHSETLNSQSTSLVTLDVGKWKKKLLQKIKSPNSHTQTPDCSKNNKIVATKAITQQPSVSKSEIVGSNNAEHFKKTESGTVAEDSGKKTVLPLTVEIESEMKNDDNETDKDAISKVDILEEVQGSEVSKISNNRNCGNSQELNESKPMKTVNDDNIDVLSFESSKNSFLDISPKVVCNVDMSKPEYKTYSNNESVCLDLLDKNVKTCEEPPNPPSKDIELTLSEDTKISDLQNKNLIGSEIHSARTPCLELKTIADISWIPDISISTPVNVANLDENTNMASIQGNSAEEAAVEDRTTTTSFNLSKKSVSDSLCVEISSEKITETVDPIEPFATTNSFNPSKESVSDNTRVEIPSKKIITETVDPVEPFATANSFNLSKVSVSDNPCTEIPSEKIITETVIPTEPFATTNSFNPSKESVSDNTRMEIPSEKIITETVVPAGPFATTNSFNLSKVSVSDNTPVEIPSEKIITETVDPVELFATTNSFNLSKVSVSDNTRVEIPSEKIITETVDPVEPFATTNSFNLSKVSVSGNPCMEIPSEKTITETVIPVEPFATINSFNPSRESVSDNTRMEIPSEKIITETVDPVEPFATTNSFNLSKVSVSGNPSMEIPSEKTITETVVPVEPFATTNSLNVYEKSVSDNACMEIPSEQIICEPVNPIEPFSATNVDDTNLLNLCNLMSNEDIVGNVTRHIVESVSSEAVCILSDIISTTMSSTDSKFPITSQAEIKNQFIPMNEVNSKKDIFDGRQVSTDNKNSDCLFSLNEQISNAGSSTLTTPSISLRLQDVPFSKIATGSSQTFDLISTNSIIQTSSESTFMSGIPVSTELTDIMENRCTNTMDHNYTIESLGGPLLSGRPEEEQIFPTTITKNAVDSTEEFSLIDNLLSSELSESDDTYKLTLDNDYAVENLVKLGGQSTDEENSFPVSNYNLEDIKRMNLIDDSISNSKDSCDSSDTIGASLTAPAMRENPWAQLITADNLHPKVVPNKQCLKTPLHNLDCSKIPSHNDDGIPQGAETRSDLDHATKDKNPWSRFIANENPSKKVVVVTNEQYLTPSFPIARDVFTKSSSFLRDSFHSEDSLLMESRNGELKIDPIKSDSSSSVKDLVCRNKLVQQKPKRSKKITHGVKEDDDFLPRRSTVLRPPPKKNAPPKTVKITQPNKDTEETSANVRLTNEGLVLLTNTELKKSVDPPDALPCKKVRFDLPQSKSPARSLAETLCQSVTVETNVKKQTPQDVKVPISFLETSTEKTSSSKMLENKSSDVKGDKRANVEDNAATWIENSPSSTFLKNGTVDNFVEMPNDACTKMSGFLYDIAELVKLRRRAASNKYSSNHNSPSPVRELKSDSIKSKKVEKPSLSRPRTATPESKVDLIEQEHGSYQDETTVPAKSNLEFSSRKVKPSPRTTTPESKPVSSQAESVQREHANSSGRSVRFNSPRSSLEFEAGKFDSEKPKAGEEKQSSEMDGKRTVYPQSNATVAQPCQSSSSKYNYSIDSILSREPKTNASLTNANAVDDYSMSRSQGTKRSLPAENSRCPRKQIKVSPSKAHHLDLNDIRFDSLRQQGNVNKLIRLRVTEDNKLKPERKFSPSLKLSRRDIDAGRLYNDGPDQNNVVRKEVDRRGGKGKDVTDIDRSLVDRSSPLTKLYGSSSKEHGKYSRSSHYRVPPGTSERQTSSSRSRSRNEASPEYNHSSGSSYSAPRSQRSKSRSYSERIKRKEVFYAEHGRTREGHEGHASGSRGAWVSHHSDHPRLKDHHMGHSGSSTSRASSSQHVYAGRSSNVMDTYYKINPHHEESHQVQGQSADNSGPYTKSGTKLTEEKRNELLKNVKDMVHKQLDSFGYKKDGAEGDFSWIEKVPLTEIRPQMTRPPNSSP